MANVTIKDSDGDVVELKATGAGSSGDPFIVEHSATLLAGSAAFGKLAANTGVDIGDVDVTSVVPGTGATSLGKAEDGAHTTGDVGVAALAVRRDAAAVGSGTDGDYSTINVDANGLLYVNVSADSALVKAEDAGHTTADKGIMALAVRNDADAALSGTDLDYTPLAVTSAGILKTQNIDIVSVLDVTPTLDTSAYDSGDVLFDTTAMTAVFRINGAAMTVDSLTVLDEDDQGIAFDLYFLDTNTSLGTFNTAPNISDANARKILGWVPVASGDYKDLGGAKVATVRNIGLKLKADSGADDLYIAAVTGGTPTHTASGLKLKLGVIKH